MPHISTTRPATPTIIPSPRTAMPATSASSASASASGFSSEVVFEPREGRTSARHEGRSALQKHVGFFDRDGDGKVGVWETYGGLRALGFGSIRSVGLAFAINTGLGRSTGASWWAPLTIDIDKIQFGKHDSDTDIYSANGRFNQQKFDALFWNFDKNQDGALSEAEFVSFFNRNRESELGSLASKAEFGLLMEIAGEEKFVDGRLEKTLSRRRLAEFYDGSLFYRIAGEPLPQDI